MKKLAQAVLICASAALLVMSGCSRSGNQAAAAPQEAAVSPSPTASSTATPAPPAASAEPSPLVPSPESGKPQEETVQPDSGKPARRESALKPVYAVGKNQVAITIDDGPTKDTGKLLKVLKDCDAKVTFFFLGQNVEKYHDSVTQAVYERHGIGYHSDVHPQMTKLNYDGQQKEFDTGLKKLEKWSKTSVKLFRPPYGSYNNDTKLITEEHGMSMILWNEDPKDWEAGDAAKITKNVLSEVRSGSIIVMHDNPSTIAALPGIVEGIRKKGYTLVTVPEPK
jgi:peptidoglycan/xylan/chitin deacetylase (PgdA/CDA1 family)